MNRIFLSHSSVDKDYVEYIADKFGKDIAMYDKFSFESGLGTFEEILRGLDSSDIFVIFLSCAALESEWVKKELNISNDLLNKDKLKQIYPIIIDKNLTHHDPRIPNWMREGDNSYILRYIGGRKIAYRKIRDQLMILNSRNNKNYNIYVGHEDLTKKFDDQYYVSHASIKCIVACGMEGIGRQSYINYCIKVPRTFNESYEPIVIDLSRTDSIDVIISKLIESGLWDDEDLTIKDINDLSFENKISLLSSIFSEIQKVREFVIFRDGGALIQHQEVVWWFAKALEPIRNELTIGIVTCYNVKHSITSKYCYIENINELDESGKLKMLDKLSKANNIYLDREDIQFFQNIVTGHPMQILFCIENIKRSSLEEVKKNSFEIKDFLSDSTIQIIDKYLALLDYKNEKKDKFLSYLSFLAGYSNIPVKEIIKINSLEEDYDIFYHDLLSFCIIRRTGLNNDLISVSPSVVDYIERCGIKIPENINNYLQKEYELFKESLKENNLDEYCYSQIEQNLKEAIIRGDYISDYKIIYPSIILKAVIKLYNNKSYDKVKNICCNSMATMDLWDNIIRQTLYFYYAMAVARKKEQSIFEILAVKVHDKEVLEKFQIDFVKGFYYKLIGHYEDAVKQFVSCLEKEHNYARARRELVETYVLLDEFNLALDLAKLNYNRFPDNIFNIYQYFNCLIRQKNADKDMISQLLTKARNTDQILSNSKQFYVEMQALYKQIIEGDCREAIKIMIENKEVFDNEVLYYRYLFDLYFELRDLEGMEMTLNNLKNLIKQDSAYLPLLFRRECIFTYVKNRDLSYVVNKIISAKHISEKTIQRIKEYVESIKL